MQARVPSPANVLPDTMHALLVPAAAVQKAKVPALTHYLVHLRASQINGCGFCVDMHARELKQSGEPDERIYAVAGWRESPYFSDAERAALALTEAVTRLSDWKDPVPDRIWEEAARHYEGQSLAALIVSIATINAWNQLNVVTRQPAGARRRSSCDA